MSDTVKRRLLLVDDDTSLLITLRDFLRFEGYDVITADSGEKALTVLAEEQEAPDLIILDMSMPGMGGIGFLKKILQENGKPLYPVLVLTARANMAEFFADVDVDGFIAKPCDPQDLLMEVTRIIFLRHGEKQVAESGMKKRLVLGESDMGAAASLSKRLRNDGYLVEHCIKGPEALECAIVNHPDVIVLNEVLDGMNGSSIAEMLSVMPNTKSVPIIIYSEEGRTFKPIAANRDGGGVISLVPSEDAETIARTVNGIFN
jgi:DNA-binding response OmpR family regulator